MFSCIKVRLVSLFEEETASRPKVPNLELEKNNMDGNLEQNNEEETLLVSFWISSQTHLDN
jgi:hypothetical protein